MNYQPVWDFFSDIDHPDDEGAVQKEVLEQVIPGVSSGALLNAMEDPAVFPEIARGDLYVQMARMRAVAPKMSAAQSMEYSKFLAAMGKVDRPEKDVQPFANVPGINIHFSGGTVSIGANTERDVTPS